jgi:hypothetical protein
VDAVRIGAADPTQRTRGAVSRDRRIERAREHFSRHPYRLLDAFERGDLDFHEWGLVSFFVAKIERARLTGEPEVAYTLAGLAEALRWERVAGGEQLRRVLHDLRDDAWIEFDDPRRGPKAPWVFRLGRAAIDGESGEFPPSLHSEDPSPVEIDSTAAWPPVPVTPHPEPNTSSSNFRLAVVLREEPSRDERQDHAMKDDHLVGEGTDATKRLRGGT